MTITLALSPGAGNALGIVGNNGISGATAQNTVNLLAGIARVRAGTGRCKVAFIGDSTTVGAYSTGTQWGANGRAKSVTRLLATLLNSRLGSSCPARCDSFYGTQNMGGTTVYQTYNPQVVLTGWTQDNSDISLGLNPFASSAGGTLAFTPAGAFDTIEILGWGNGTATLAVNVDGGSTLQTFTPTSGSNGVQVFTVSSGISLATHTINLVSSATGIVVVGVSVRTSTAPAIEFYDYAFSGADYPLYLNAIGNANVRPLAALAVAAPNVTFINLTINDINLQPTSVAQYSINAQLFITQALATGDCYLVVGNPCNPSGETIWAPPATIPNQYIAAVYALGQSNGIPVIDIVQRWGSYAAISPVMPYGDANVHPTGVGYADIAAAYSSLFQ